MKPKKIHYYLTGFLLFQLVLIRIMQHQTGIIEKVYSNGIYPFVSSFFRILFGWVPFSMGDLLLFFLIFLILRFFYKLFKTRFRNLKLRFFQITSFVSIIYFCFYFFWGMNYYRETLAKNLGFKQQKYSTEELVELSEYFVDKLNQAQLNITQSDTLEVENPLSPKDMYILSRKGYDSLALEYPQFNYRFASVKSSLMSTLQTYNGTTGYMNPLTGEAQVNKLTPTTSYPTTICHEIAHQLGIAAENEANFVGYLAAVHNKNLYFQYAAYRMATRYTVFELAKRDPEKFRAVYRKLNKGILKDFKSSYEHWKQYQNPFEPLIKKGYNAYLKANNQSKGVDSYNYVVDLFISYYGDRESVVGGQ